MIVVMKHDAADHCIRDVVARIESDGYMAHLSQGAAYTIIGVVGESPTPLRQENYSSMEGVEKVVRISESYKLANRTFHPADTHIAIGGVTVGAAPIAIIGGPCSVESREQIIETAWAVKEAGGVALRGGAYKPRTSPYSFQGHAENGLKWLAEARQQTGLPIVTEVMDAAQLPIITQYADVLQVGARNMQNFTLLSAVGQTQTPVLLKRGMSATIKELLMSAEYILAQGNRNVMVCERGIRTFETETRNTSDINAIPVLKEKTHLPVVFDPSHATGKWEYVEALSLAGVAAGVDALIIEVHLNPEQAMSDGRQSLTPQKFAALVQKVQRLAEAVGRSVLTPATAVAGD